MTRSARAAAVFAWSVWTLMVVATLGFIGAFGSRLPYVDDWDFVPYLTGDRTDSGHWLWEQVTQHRYLLNKAVFLGLVEIGRGDFRFVLFFHALALGAVAWAMIRTAGRLRGRIAYSDAFFPLLLLHWGLAPHLLLASNGLFYGLPTILASLLLLAVVRTGSAVSVSSSVLAGACLVLLTSSSGTGILYTPGLALCVALLGLDLWRAPGPWAKLHGTIVLALTAAALVVVALYFVDFHAHGYGVASSPNLWGKLRVSIAFMGCGLGWPPGAWPYSGVAVLLLVLACAGILARRMAREHGAARVRARSLLLFLGACGCLVVGIGWGREAGGVSGSFGYRPLALPILCCVYYVWGIYGGRVPGSVVQAALFFSVALWTGIHTEEGIAFGRAHRAELEAFERDLRDELPPYLLIARHKENVLFWGTHDDMARYLRMLQRAGIGPFRSVPEDPAFRELPAPVTPSAASGILWNGGAAHGSGRESYLEFTLPEPLFVAGVRVRATHSNPESAYMLVSYVTAATDGMVAPGTVQQTLWAWPGYSPLGGPIGGAPRAFVVYVGDTVRALRIYPDNAPFEFQVSEIAWLIPASGTTVLGRRVSAPAELDTQPTDRHHSQQLRPMAEPPDVRAPVGSRAIAHRDIDDAEAEDRRRE